MTSANEDGEYRFPLNFETGMVQFMPVDRRTGERLSLEIVYRTFPRNLEYHGVIIDPATRRRYRVLGKECSVPGCNCDAWVEELNDASMPDFYPSPEHDAWSVQVNLPEDVDEFIAAREDLDSGEIWTTIIHGALWQTRLLAMDKVEQRMDLVSELYPSLQDVDKGEFITLEEFRATFHDRLRERMELLKGIKRGNLPLPERLYLFVLEQIDSGLFNTPSDFVAAAVRSPNDAARQTVAGRWRVRLEHL